MKAPAGARIVEEAVASQLQVSRVPIREAIKILQAQGILQVLPNRGARDRRDPAYLGAVTTT